MSCQPGAIILITCLLAGTAAAGSPKKAATKALEASTEQILLDVKETVKLHKQVLVGEIKDVESNVEAGIVTADAGVSDLFDALVQFQTDVVAAILEANEDIRLAEIQARSILEDASVPIGSYPKGFLFGDNGLTDDLRDSIAARVDKTLAAVENRLATTAKLMKKVAATSLTVRLASPAHYVERTWFGPHVDPYPITIDVALGTSELGVTDDGMLYLAGSCRTSSGDLSVVIGHESTVLGLPTVTPDAGERWQTSATDLAEGNYSMHVLASGCSSGGGYAAIGIK